MAQKINPISLRLGKTNRNFDSCWFNDSNYVNLLMRDLKIQIYINYILKKIKYCSARYLIQNLPNKVKINVFFCNSSKNRKIISKIFYLSNPKKIKKSKKNFFNIQQNKISVKHSKILNYLIKNFSDNLSKITANEKDKILYYYKYANVVPNKTNLDNIVFFKNYLKLLYSIKKYDQFYIRYFLIKYLNFKYHTISLKKVQFKQSLNILFLYIINFLFFKIYKNKKFIALNYYKSKINNYKLITHNFTGFSNLIQKNMVKENNNKIKLKKKVFIKFNSYSLNQFNYDSNLLPTFFFNNVVLTKLKILSYLNKFILKYKKVSNFHSLNLFKLSLPSFCFKNKRFKEFFEEGFLLAKQKNKFFSPFLLEKKIIPTFTNFTAFIKLNIHSKSLQLCSKINNEFTLSSSTKNLFFFPKSNIFNIFNSEKSFLIYLKLKTQKHKILFNHKQKISFNIKNNLINFPFALQGKAKKYLNIQNLKYYNVSLMNNQIFNDTYNKYCKLSESYKYYNSIYSHDNLSFEKKNLLKYNLNYNEFNLNSSLFLPKNKKVFTLISSPYKNHMESVISNHFSCNINFNFFQTTNIFQNALFFIDEIIYYIEKKVAFFKIKNYILKKLTEQKFLRIKGIRVMCSGRIGGKSKKAQRSKIQNFKYGETSLHVFSSKIDFKSKNAFTSFGTLGVKVWICYH